MGTTVPNAWMSDDALGKDAAPELQLSAAAMSFSFLMKATALSQAAKLMWPHRLKRQL